MVITETLLYNTILFIICNCTIDLSAEDGKITVAVPNLDALNWNKEKLGIIKQVGPARTLLLHPVMCALSSDKSN